MADYAATMRDFQLKVPARFKTISGKIRRTELRQMERERMRKGEAR